MPDATPVRCARQGYDPKAIEADALAFWARDDTRANVRRLREKAPKFYFVDGPPYTSGHIHIGTAWNKVMKDLLVRHWTMKGYNVRDQPGWDMHGLPIEVKVEKELGISNKKEIEAFGVGNFVEKCRAFALKFLGDMTEEFKELGVWLDWPRPYRTIDDTYMEGAWWAIRRAHEKGLLYRENRGGLPWCPRCETALAQAEIEYEDRDDPSIYVKFKVEGREEYLVIWTTTPWTLPANMAIAANPEFSYARVLATKRGGSTETIIVEDSLVDAVAHAAKYEDATVLDHIRGRDLAGTRYEHPFRTDIDYHKTRRSAAEYTVILGAHVAADRTGLVHTATGHGAEDFEAGRANGIAPFCPVGPDGTYTGLTGWLQGLVVKKPPAGAPEDGPESRFSADRAVIGMLRERGLLLAEGVDRHSYGHCWRCKTPILYLTTEQWFLAVTKVKDKMLAEVGRVKWTPDWAGAARQRDWVENARDWCISRQRYWGIPLPVWECESCERYEVLGSKHELLQRAGLAKVEDLHRPWVDKVTFPCTCGMRMTRVPDVLDVWFDSAVASWASLGYPGDEKAFKQWFPSDLIIEGLDQTRGWFYSQLAAGVVAMDRVPYEEVVMHGFVHDQDGRPMSKSLGNIVAPSEVISKYGADALRWSLLETCAPWEDLHFGPDIAKEAQRVLNILWNVHYFSTQYMALDGYVAHGSDWTGKPPADAVDAWLLSRLCGLVEDATRLMGVHEYHRAARAMKLFVLEDLSRWYVRLNRDRAWRGSEVDKRALYDLLAVTLGTLARLFAPYTPHFADVLWHDLYPGAPSVNAQDWPKAVRGLRDEPLERDMAVARSIVEAVSQAREQANLSLRWPVPRVVIVGDERVAGAARRLATLLEDQCNAKRIEYAGTSWGELKAVAQPDRKVIGPLFKQDGQRVVEAIRAADATKLQGDLERQGRVQLAGFTIAREMVQFSTAVPEGILGASFEGGSCFVDAHLTPALEAEGLARELQRRIQEMRKEADLALEAVVPCLVEASDTFVARVKPHAKELADEARVKLSFGQVGAGATEWKIKDERVRITLG